jgi:hypothetical protein
MENGRVYFKSGLFVHFELKKTTNLNILREKLKKIQFKIDHFGKNFLKIFRFLYQ